MSSWAERLQTLDEEAFENHWGEFFLNENHNVAFLKETDKDGVVATCTRGQTWRGTGWTTTRCSITMRKLTGVAMVESNVTDYLHSFLYALSLAAGVDLPLMHLGDKAAEASFKLFERWQTHLTGHETALEAGDQDRDEQLEEGGGDSFTWQTHEEDLPPDLSQILGQLGRGELQLETRHFLDQVPSWKTLKSRAEENNHRQDGKSGFDRTLKATQQKILNMMRVHATIHCTLTGAPEEVVSLSQQLFAYMALAEQEVVKERKRRSIPTTIAQGNGLFSQDDMKQAREVTAINKGGFSGMSRMKAGVPKSYFPMAAGPKAWKWKPWRVQAQSRPWRPFNFQGKGKGKGKGKGQSRCGLRHGQSGDPLTFTAEQSTLQQQLAEAKSRHGAYHGLTCPEEGGSSVGSGICEPSGGSEAYISKQQLGPLHASDCRDRKPFWSNSSLSEVATLPPLVGKTRSRSSAAIDQTWRSGRVGYSSNSSTEAIPKKSPRGGGSNKNLVGVPRGRSSKTSSLGGIKTFGSLVHHQNVRGAKYKSTTHCRLQKVKSLFSATPLSAGSPAKHFSLPEKRSMGSQGRLERCLFSPSGKSVPQTLHQVGCGKNLLGVSRSMFRSECTPSKIHEPHEGSRKSLEGTRYPSLCLFRRHPVIGRNRKASSNSTGKGRYNLAAGRVQNKHKEKCPVSSAKHSTLGFSVESQKGLIGNKPRKIKDDSEGAGKSRRGKEFELSKNGGHFGGYKVLPSSPSLSKSLHRPVCAVRKPSQTSWLGPHQFGATKSERSVDGIKGSAPKLAGQALSESSDKNFAQRLQQFWLGRHQCKNRGGSAGILETKKGVAHKHQGTFSCHRNGEITGETRGKHLSLCGQHHSLFLLAKTRRQVTPLECNSQTLSTVLSEEQNYPADKMGAIRRNASRQAESVVIRCGGLHPKSPSFSSPTGKILPVHFPTSRHVQLPGKLSVEKICIQMAPSLRPGDQRLALQPQSVRRGLRQPPLECHQPVATPSERGKTHKMSSGVPILGFSTVVAPVNQAAHSKNAMFFDSALRRNVSELSQSVHEKAKVAPSLFTVVRKFMEKQQIPVEVANDFLQRKTTLLRYDAAFRLLWGALQCRGIQPENASVHDVAASIVQLFSFSPAGARNAYTAMSLLPGFHALRFHSLLLPYKRIWNSHLQKYAVFWDPSPVIHALSQRPVEQDIVSLRERLIILLRILCLHRSVDLSRVLRTVSLFEKRPFILIRRKGWTMYRWEEIPQVPECPAVCPWTVLQKYVTLTAGQAPAGGPLFVALQPPFKPLTANSLGSLTKKIMCKFGIPPEWGPHSTRGAGVTFYKKAGLSSEEVCQLGQWRDVNSFTSHYLRIEASQRAGETVAELVHKSSLGRSAEPELSRTPGNPGDPGGRDNAGEAQKPSEVLLFLPACVFFVSGRFLLR